jgi:hypothetical protein
MGVWVCVILKKNCDYSCVVVMAIHAKKIPIAEIL